MSKVFAINVDEIKRLTESPLGQRLTLRFRDVALELRHFQENKQLIQQAEQSLKFWRKLMDSTPALALVLAVIFGIAWAFNFFPMPEAVLLAGFVLAILYVVIFLLQLALPGIIEDKSRTLNEERVNQDFVEHYLDSFVNEWYFLKAYLVSNNELLEQVSDDELKNRIEEVVFADAIRLVRLQEEFARLNRTDAKVVAAKANVIINISDDLTRLIDIINTCKFADDEVKFGNLMQAARDRLEQEKRDNQSFN